MTIITFQLSAARINKLPGAMATDTAARTRMDRQHQPDIVGVGVHDLLLLLLLSIVGSNGILLLLFADAAALTVIYYYQLPISRE